ncbi:MAG: exonuclease domain-containing protein [Planctomycetota bacterium]
MTNLVAFDFETTGLYPMKDKIIEIGAICFNPESISRQEPRRDDADDGIIKTFQTFVNPGLPIPQEVIAIHGITDEMVKNAPSGREALSTLLDFIGDSPLLAHNISFDVSFLMASAALYKIKPPSNLLIDTCELARICFRDVENHKLSTLGRYLNIVCPSIKAFAGSNEQSGYHRALADSYVVMKLYKMCLDRLDSKITIDDVALRSTGGLRFDDYIFDKIEIPPDKIALKKAIEQSIPIEITYRNNKGEETQRWITPFNIFSFRGKTYLAAHCHQVDEIRQFRLDRICEVISCK